MPAERFLFVKRVIKSMVKSKTPPRQKKVKIERRKEKPGKIKFGLIKEIKEARKYSLEETDSFIKILKADEKKAGGAISEITKKGPKSFNFQELKKYFGKGTKGNKKAGQYMELWKLEKRYRNWIDSFTIATIDAGKVPDYTRRAIRTRLISSVEEIRKRMSSLLEEGKK